MTMPRTIPRCVTWVFVLCLFGGLNCAAFPAEDPPPAVAGLMDLDVPGGLVVQLGAGDTQLVVELARTGRFLVHVLEDEADLVEQTRRQLQDDGLYGLVSVEQRRAGQPLPYAENLVNLVIVRAEAVGETLAEVVRVLRPSAIVLGARDAFSAERLKAVGLRPHDVSSLGSEWMAARKPWPDTLDEWTHPRHSAAGNAVSQDTAVGPPRRVRWLAGPWAEVANLVTSEGRNFYGGILARDGFNGLRLWRRDLAPSPSRGGFGFRSTAGSMPPVTGAGRVFVFTEGKLQALDNRTGETIRDYPEVGSPLQTLYDQGLLITVGAGTVHGVDADSGRVLWTHSASEPREIVAGDGFVGLLQGSPRRGETCEVIVLDQRSGRVRWSRGDLPWAARVSRLVYHRGMLACEVSTLNDDGPENALYILSADDGQVVREIPFLPGMNHMRQARAMFVDNDVWLLQGGRVSENRGFPVEATAIDVRTGNERARFPAGLAHCFPPVATPRFLLSGEMDFTDMQTGQVDANRITKAACGRDAGWFLAHGLVYVTPKHCVCWPMLRGYAALAPERPGGSPAQSDVSQIPLDLETGVLPLESGAPSKATADWPGYRCDAWRSSQTSAPGPRQLAAIWTVALDTAAHIDGPILEDWQDDPYIKGPVSPPVIAEGRLFVTRPHRHQVLALDAKTGATLWQFTANGRVDTPPTLHRGLCLFGSKSGCVYCLRAADGQLVWRLQVAPLDERIVAYGQLESPWPVPGSVLVIDNVAYFAAGRQSFADGGILLFAVDPATGQRQWVQRLSTVPQQGYYTSSALEFDNFDLLFREGEGVAMARWVFDRQTGAMSVDLWKAFSRLNTGRGSAMVPHGSWSYAPRNQTRTVTFSPRRPLVVFRDNVLWGCLESKQAVYRRDFNLEGGEEFDTKWITGWANSDASRNNGIAWPSQRLAEKARWTTQVYPAETSQATIDALVLAGDELYLGGSDGELRVLAADDGRELRRQSIPTPVWDGLAVADGRLYLTTHDGQVVCLGD